MTSAVSLGSVLTKSGNWIQIDPLSRYTELTVHLWGRGVSARRAVEGSEIAGQRRLKVLGGEFVVSRIDARHGAFAVIPDDLDGAVVSNDFPAFRPDPDRLVPDYLGWLSRTHYFVDACRAASEGTTNRVRLKEDKFAQIEIPLPPLAEQWRIVAEIERLAAKLDEAREHRRLAEVGLKACWPSILDDVLLGDHWIADSCGLENAALLLQRQSAKYQGRPASAHNNSHVDNPTVLDGTRSLPDKWIWTTLGSVAAHIVDCVNDTPEFVGEDTGYLGLKSTNVRPYRFDVRDRWYVTKVDFDHWNRRAIPQPGDLLLTREAPMGYACILPEGYSVCLTQRLMLLRSDDEFIASQYLLHYLNSPVFHEQVSEKCRGMTVPHIRVQDAPQFLVPLPPIEVQRRIVAYLHGLQAKVDHLKTLQEQTLAELDALLPSILDRAFKGEL